MNDVNVLGIKTWIGILQVFQLKVDGGTLRLIPEGIQIKNALKVSFLFFYVYKMSFTLIWVLISFKICGTHGEIR